MATTGEPTGSAPAPQPSYFGVAWSDQSVRLVALGIGILVVLWLARGIIGPFVVAGVLAYAFSPVVAAVQTRTRLPRVAVVALGYAIFLAAFAVVAFFTAQRIGREISELTLNGHDIIGSAMHKLFGDSVVVAGNTYNVDELVRQLRIAVEGVANSPAGVVQLVERVADLALQALLCLIITFYLLLDGHRFGQFALRFLARERRADTLRLAQRIHGVLGRWLRGQLLLIGLVSVVLYVILGPILHVPYALMLGLMSGFLEIIPLVGPLVAASIAGTVTFAAHGTDTTIVVLGVYVVVRQVEDQVVMPLVIGRAVHLHPVITIFAVLAGLSTWGVLGGLLGVPVAAAINVTLRELYPEETGGHEDKVVSVGKMAPGRFAGRIPGRTSGRKVAMVSGPAVAVGPDAGAAELKPEGRVAGVEGALGSAGGATAVPGPTPAVPGPTPASSAELDRPGKE
ncbi:MAG TPA: AI-2E family transporter [Candidatus Limnocylindrales bacterium]